MKNDVYFPEAIHYPPNPPFGRHILKESGHRGRIFQYTERHLQAVWFDAVWRPMRLMTTRGETVVVEYPGRWNLEAGPDFLGATLRVGPDERRITGDVEVHIFPADWRRHRHGEDPRYRNVCLHVTYFDGMLADDELPSGALQLALQPMLKTDASFAFEHIDVTSYPYAGRADLPPCRKVLADWPVEQKIHLLEAAGHERMSRKASKFSDAIRERGIDQVVYEAFLLVLGYHQNKSAFLELSRRLPVERLRVVCNRDFFKSYAVLAGMAGLLPDQLKNSWDEESRTFVRSLWDIWWKEREQMSEPMHRTDWNLGGMRPLNHPLRRLMSAAHVFSSHQDGQTLLEGWFHGDWHQLVDRMILSAEPNQTTYWRHRASLGGVKVASPIAMVGRDRVEIMALNAAIPLFAAVGFSAEQVAWMLRDLHAEPLNMIMKQAVHYLFGPDVPSSFYNTANRRQGLLQIFHDYCLHDRSRCARCPLPGYLQQQVVP